MPTVDRTCKMASSVRTEEIYEALFDDAAFARLPDLLSQAGNARSALLLWQHYDGFSETLAFNYFPKAMMDVYGAKWSTADPWVIGGLRSGQLNEVILLEPYVPVAIYEQSPFYNDFIRDQNDDTFHCAGGILRSAWGQGVIGVQRGRSAEAFDADDVKRVNATAVHVERVLRARGEMAAARRAAAFAQGVLDAVGLVAITVKSDGQILHSNETAEIVLRRADALIHKGGRLRALMQDAQNRLGKAVSAATVASNPVATAVSIERGPNEPAYLVTVTPLVGRIGHTAALVLFRDPDTPDHSLAGRLRDLFNLTNAEAAVAIDLANGLTVADIARNRGVRTTTLRSQLKSIGLKTACPRQSELVALLRRLPPISGR